MKYMLQMLISLSLLCSVLLLGCAGAQRLPVESTSKQSLAGEWEVVDQTMTPLRIIPDCNAIVKGALFQFKQDTLRIYTDSSGSPCDVFSYKTAKQTISIIKADMVWLCTYQWGAGMLRLQSDTFFTPGISDSSGTSGNPSKLIQGISITLKRKQLKSLP